MSSITSIREIYRHRGLSIEQLAEIRDKPKVIVVMANRYYDDDCHAMTKKKQRCKKRVLESCYPYCRIHFTTGVFDESDFLDVLLEKDLCLESIWEFYDKYGTFPSQNNLFVTIPSLDYAWKKNKHWIVYDEKDKKVEYVYGRVEEDVYGQLLHVYEPFRKPLLFKFHESILNPMITRMKNDFRDSLPMIPDIASIVTSYLSE